MGFKVQRVAARKTIKETAKYMQVSNISVWQWETGRFYPTADKLAKLAAFYGCTVDQLLEGNPVAKKGGNQ